MVAQVRGTTGLHLALAWGFVGIPLAWGVVETVLNALKLFQYTLLQDGAVAGNLSSFTWLRSRSFDQSFERRRYLARVA